MAIELPALAVQTPQQPSLLDRVARVQQLQNMAQQGQLQQQQIQAGQLENQMRQRDLQDQQMTMQILSKHGGDLDSALPELAQHVSAKTYMGLQKAHLEMQKDVAKLQGDKLDNKLKVDNAVSGLIDSAKQLPPDQYAAAWPQIAAQAVQLDPTLKDHVNPQQPIPQDQLNQVGLLYQTQTAALAKAKEQREAAAAAAKLPGEQAESQLKQLQVQQAQAGGAVPGVPLDVQEANSWLKAHPGKTLADYKKYAATLVPAFNVNMQAGLLNDQAKQMAAQMYAQTGQLPAGMRSPAMSAGILNQAATGPGGVPNIAANKATFQANEGSLKALQKNFDQVTAFENTAGKNLDVFLKTAQKVIDSGSPWINKPLRSVASGALGSEDQAAFNAARQTAVTEIAKVLNSSNASGVLSDSARHEVEGLIGPNASLKQIVSAANILKQDMANRHNSYQEQISDIKGRLGSKPATTPTAPAQSGDFFSQFGGKAKQ